VNMWTKILTAVGATLAWSSVCAQSTLGELKAVVATKLDAAQVKALVSGSNLSGPTQNGGNMSVDYKADGGRQPVLRVDCGRRMHRHKH